MKKLRRIIAVAICLVLGCSGVVSAEETNPRAVKNGMLAFTSSEVIKNKRIYNWTIDLNRVQLSSAGYTYEEPSKKEKKEAKKALNKITKKYNNLSDLDEQGYTDGGLHVHNGGKSNSPEFKYFNYEDHIAMMAYKKLQKGNSKLFDKYVKFNAISNYTDVDFSDYIMTNDQLASYMESAATIRYETEQLLFDAAIVDSVSVYMIPYDDGIGLSRGTCIMPSYTSHVDSYELADVWGGTWDDNNIYRVDCTHIYKSLSSALPLFLASEGFLKSKGYLPEDWVYPKTADCDSEHSKAKTFIYVPDVDYDDGYWDGRSDDNPMAVKVKMSKGSRTLKQGYFTAIGDNEEVMDADFVTCSYGKPSFSIADESIATVDSNGVITPHQTGETTITIYVAANGTYEAAERTVPLIVSK